MRWLGKAIKKALRETVKLSTLGLKTGKHFTRYRMNLRLEEVLGSIDKSALGNRVLSISRSGDLFELLHLNQPELIEANYPEYNLFSLPFKDGSFDYVVCGQILEHVQGDPQKAIDETFRVLKKGGIAVYTTCFMNPIHMAPDDYWRFTTYGLSHLFKEFSEIIEVGGWGNHWLWPIEKLGLRMHPIPHATWHPLHRLAIMNDPDVPIVTWIVAKK